MIPYSIISPNSTKTIDGKYVKCRNYPWGAVDIEVSISCNRITRMFSL